MFRKAPWGGAKAAGEPALAFGLLDLSIPNAFASEILSYARRRLSSPAASFNCLCFLLNHPTNC